MANEQKEVKTPRTKSCTDSTRIAVNIIAVVLIIVVSFAAGFGVSTLINSGKKDWDGRPDFGRMPQMGGDRKQESRSGDRGKFAPNDNNEDSENDAPSRPQRKNENSDSASKS